MEPDKNIVVYAADVREKQTNCLYPHRIEITDEKSAATAFSHDFVCAQYKNNYRGKDNFLQSNSLPMDCDNDHSQIPEEWITADDVANFFEGVTHIVHYSRHHMKPKGEKSARPRFHIIFQINTETDSKKYFALKDKIQECFPYFDTNAMDSGRLMFGTENPEVIYRPGNMTVDEFIADFYSLKAFESLEAEIPEGKRNSTMSKIGARIIKRYGDTGEAYELFLKEAEKCNPPLDDRELNAIWKSAQSFYSRISKALNYISPEKYNEPESIEWEIPIPFDEYNLPVFPVDALPLVIGNYVRAVAESTQTSVDMAAVASLAIISVCIQGKYRIVGKYDWTEPLNTYCVIILPPAERKSAVIALMTSPLEEYEREINLNNDAAIIENQMRKSVLEKQRKMLEDKVSKGKADADELTAKSKEIAEFEELMPLKLFVDDVTTEKLSSVLSQNKGRAAIISAEGGIFDILKGLYSKNVNIDVFLKGHSGDTIRVDRIGRASESIMHPALTILLSVQPEVLNGLMSNGTFQGRGLNARFLYSMPKSYLGARRFQTAPIGNDVHAAYQNLIWQLLELVDNEARINLSPAAFEVLEKLFNKTELRFRTDLSEIKDWAGKYVGAVLRIAGLLHAAQRPLGLEFSDVSEETMRNAVRIGEYFLEHAKAAYSLMGADPVNKQCEYILEALKQEQLTEFSRRDVMRMCRRFKTVDALQPALSRLCEYGYIAPKPETHQNYIGRKPSEVYLTNPAALES